jgi:hypothetical protein
MSRECEHYENGQNREQMPVTNPSLNLVALAEAEAKENKGKDYVPTSPDAMRVWCGFNLPGTTADNFHSALGSILIPATVETMQPLGLTAYQPTVLPDSVKASIPNEIALVFYESQSVYGDSTKNVNGRSYQRLHRAIFDFGSEKSFSSFPVLFGQDGGDKVETRKPYYLFAEKTDWQYGRARVFVGARKEGQSAEEFRANIGKTLKSIQAEHQLAAQDCQANNASDGMVAVATNDAVCLWEHWSNKEAASSKNMDKFKAFADPVLEKAPEDTSVPLSGYTPYAGLDIHGGEALNLRFPRR